MHIEEAIIEIRGIWGGEHCPGREKADDRFSSLAGLRIQAVLKPDSVFYFVAVPSDEGVDLVIEKMDVEYDD